MRMKKILLVLLFILSFTTNTIFGFDFLINLFFGMLPQPVRSAFKGEGLENKQFQYGFGNCAFTSLSYLNSELKISHGSFFDEYKFEKPTFTTFAAYISHVSTPVFLTVYPGWQLELEVGFGGTVYDSAARQLTEKFYFSGLSGFNWQIYRSAEIKKYSWTLNLGFGYKLHSFLNEQIYYNLQTGVILIPNILSSSLEYLSTLQGGKFFILRSTAEKFQSKEHTASFSLNWFINEKYILKLGTTIKNYSTVEILNPSREIKINFYGIFISLLTK